MSRFTDKMFHNAMTSTKGMVTGEPHEPVRHTWREVHERARRVAGGVAAAGVGPGDAVGVLAGAPVEIAPTAQGLWMRGASLTMLHQPTPRTDLVHWAEDTTNVIDMIEAKAVIISDPFLAAAPVLAERGVTVLTVEEVEHLLSHLTGMHKLLALLMYGTGMRILEVLRLRIKDIEFARKTIVVRDGKVLLCQRGEGGRMERLWQFPAVLLPKESARWAARWKSKFGVLKASEWLATLNYSVTNHRIRLELHRIEGFQRYKLPAAHWVPLAEVPKLAFTAAHRKLANRFLAGT